MAAPVVHINGHPGTGKLTIARALQNMMPGARLLDNHALLDPALALYDRGTPEMQALREVIRTVVFQAAKQVDPEVPIILTDALDDSDYAAALFYTHVVGLTDTTKRPLFRFILDIDEDENIHRIQSPERHNRRKLTDPHILKDGRANHRILGTNEPGFVHIDVTHLSADAAASALLGHLMRSAS